MARSTQTQPNRLDKCMKSLFTQYGYIDCCYCIAAYRLLHINMFIQKNRPGNGQQNSNYCRIHNQRIIQLGNCLTCNTIASICQSKGCIKNHQQNERIHNVLTIQYVRNIVKEFLSSDQSKKSYLKKMVSQYFEAAKKQMEVLYEEIYQAIEYFKFDNIIFREEENLLIQKLIQEDFNSISCSQIAVIIPKLIKYANFEDGHFVHLREYLKNQRQKIPGVLDGIILNLPYFRDTNAKKKQKQFVEISSEWLREVNDKLKAISFRPKKLRIKYIDDEGQQDQKRQFIRRLCTIQKITSVEELELYCVWNVHGQDFQIAFFQALMRYPFLRKVSIYTDYKITDTRFINQVVSEGTMDVKVYKKQWTFQ